MKIRRSTYTYMHPISIICLCIIVFITACSNTRYLPPGETLYMGSKVKIQDTFTTSKAKKAMEEELNNAIRPRRNAAFLGMRIKLSIYNWVGEPKSEKGLRNWIRNKIGEPPVLGSSVNIAQNEDVLESYLTNRGYFHSEAQGIKDTHKRKTTAVFDVNTGKQYTIKSVKFPDPSEDKTALTEHIIASEKFTLLKEGEPYNLDILILERERIDNYLKKIGYYYFTPENLLIKVDTGVGNHQVGMELQVKWDDMPYNSSQQYTINSVQIFPNYRIEQQSANQDSNRNRRTRRYDTTYYESFSVISRGQSYRPSIFKQAMQLRPNEYYNKAAHNIALNRLVTLGTFKFVKSEFSPVRDSNNRISDRLNVAYMLTPYPKKSWDIELGAFTLNDSRAGSRASILWRNRNFLGGAELFSARFSGSFEAQFGGVVQRPNTYNFSVETSLNVPRFLVPFFSIQPSGLFIPKTVMNVNYSYAMRVGMYQLQSLNLGFGYNWKEDAQKEHRLFPINLTFVRTDTFDNHNANEFNLSNVVFNGVIVGPTYEYTYNSQIGTNRNHNFYFNGLLDLSGNILGLAQGTKTGEVQKKILGTNYAQYIKVQLDGRFYQKITNKSDLATRLILGYGYAYGNSSNMPNVKQFFAGGSNSLRGFPSRFVGPGTYHGDNTQSGIRFLEMLGDIKLEANVEYRSKLYSFINWAAFLDAGNIWLLRSNASFPGGEFTSDFYKQIAVSGGLGLRLDFSILVLRLDFAIPLRKPWYTNTNAWTFNEIDLLDGKWRTENLMFNLAIGMPF